MAQVLILRSPVPGLNGTLSRRSQRWSSTHSAESWVSVQRSVKYNGKFSCLFSDNRKQEQARKALESALGEKKTEFEKWDKEIKRREEAGGGGNSGGGGWFRWGGWFGGSDGDRFWQEAQQASLAILGILVMYFVVVFGAILYASFRWQYLIVAKGDAMLAVIINPLLFALRGTRTALSFLTTKIMNRIYPTARNIATPQVKVAPVSVKDRVLGKWGSN